MIYGPITHLINDNNRNNIFRTQHYPIISLLMLFGLKMSNMVSAIVNFNISFRNDFEKFYALFVIPPLLGASGKTVRQKKWFK